MVEVRIRHEYDQTPKHLCEVPWDRIDEVIPTLRGWGINDYDMEHLSGQFMVDESGAYFEVLIGAGDDD